MKTESVDSVTEYLKLVDEVSSAHFDKKRDVRQEGHPLYRGQCQDFPLLPKIARNEQSNDHLSKESYMLSELKIRGRVHRDIAQLDIWGLLTLGQHYGLATRLLDWTRNPLVAMGNRGQMKVFYVVCRRQPVHPFDHKPGVTQTWC